MKRIIITSSCVRFKPLEKPIALMVKTLMEEMSIEGFLEISLVDGNRMNKNVLAYQGSADFPRPDITGTFLGEIYLNPTYIKKHQESLTFMVIHGFLHTVGYDHMKRNDRIKMEKKEGQLFKKLKGLSLD